MKKWMLSLVLAFVIAAPAFSQMMKMGHMGEGDMGSMGDMGSLCIEHADAIGLTDGQVVKMKPLRNNMKKVQARFNADMKIAEIEHMEIMDVRDFNMDKARSSVDKMENLKKDHHMAMLAIMKDMRSILTDVQFKKMNTMMNMKPVEKKNTKTMKKN